MWHAIDEGPEHAQGALALDAELFQASDERRTGESRRVWECRHVAVIVGRSGLVRTDVYEERCLAENVPILRRISGGGAVVVGPGCLNYSLVLSLDRRPELQNVARSYEIILGQIAAVLDLPGLAVRGRSDLAWNERKVSGSAQRRGRHALLHHGTFLCGFDVGLMERYLKNPTRQPAYRRGRAHAEFVDNLPMSAETVRARLAHIWGL